MKRRLLLSLLPIALLLLAAGVLALQSSGEAQGGAARGNSAACAAVHTNVDGGALVSSVDWAGPSLGGGALLAAECYFVGISRLIGGCGGEDLYILRYLCYTPAKGWFYQNYAYCAPPAGPRYVYSPSDYVYEAAPDHSLGWPYYTQTRVEYYQYSDYQRVTERRHYWNIYDQNVASNCRIDWYHTPEAPLSYPDDQWYDFWNTPVYLYGRDFFITPYYGDGYNSLTEMYYGWTHQNNPGDGCVYLNFAWGTDTGGWIMQTFKESGSWRWYACHHNAGDPDCPNWQY